MRDKLTKIAKDNQDDPFFQMFLQDIDGMCDNDPELVEQIFAN